MVILNLLKILGMFYSIPCAFNLQLQQISLLTRMFILNRTTFLSPSTGSGHKLEKLFIFTTVIRGSRCLLQNMFERDNILLFNPFLDTL